MKNKAAYQALDRLQRRDRLKALAAVIGFGLVIALAYTLVILVRESEHVEFAWMEIIGSGVHTREDGTRLILVNFQDPKERVNVAMTKFPHRLGQPVNIACIEIRRSTRKGTYYARVAERDSCGPERTGI